MTIPICIEATEKILASISRSMGDDGLKASFFFGEPGASISNRQLGTEIYYHNAKLQLASLFVRRNGAAHLKALTMREIDSSIKAFISENFWHLRDTMFDRSDTAFDVLVGQEAKSALAEALLKTDLFSPVNKLHLFPISTVVVETPFCSELFALGNMKDRPFDQEYAVDFLSLDSFPPIADSDVKRTPVSSWLWVSSPSKRAALKMRGAIIGALSLTQSRAHRYMVSGREVISGWFTMDDGSPSYGFDGRHTPACGYDLRVTERDKVWLSSLKCKMGSNAKTDRIQVKALEYFYRAWFVSASERFPILCMALDAVFGDPSKATQSVIAGVRSVLGNNIEAERLRLLMAIRASVIHGGAPDVYDSKKYEKYWIEYKADPIVDLELIVAACLKAVVFEERLQQHESPDAALIAKMQAAGTLPKKFNSSTII